jgi:hypothetical protein
MYTFCNYKPATTKKAQQKSMGHRLNIVFGDFATMSSLYLFLTLVGFSKKINLIFEKFFH